MIKSPTCFLVILCFHAVLFIPDQVLYKSRCDNRLNEITERAIADKREVSYELKESPATKAYFPVLVVVCIYSLDLVLSIPG